MRRSNPGQYGIKGDCTIGVIDARHILVILEGLEDYVNFLSIAAYYIKAKEMYSQMRKLKWDPWFEPHMETTIGVAWISMTDLFPIVFAKEPIFFDCFNSRETFNNGYGNEESDKA